MDEKEFKIWAEKIAEYLVEYKNKIHDYKPIPPSRFGEGFKGLKAKISENGESFDVIFKDFTEKIMPRIVHWNHPYFFSHIPSPNSYPSVLADMISAAIGGVGFSWVSNPALTELEDLMSDWYADILNLPAAFTSKGSNRQGGGCFQQTPDNAVYNIILAARRKAISHLSHENTSTGYEVLGKFVVYASTDANASVIRACKADGIRLRTIPVNRSGVMRADTLIEIIQKDQGDGLIPILVVGTLGGFLRFGIDELEKIGEYCRTQPILWYHVDGSFGASILMLDDFRQLTETLKNADSFVATASNWLMISFDSTYIWVKDVEEYQKVFIVNPKYLQHSIVGAIDYRNYGIPLSRRFRAMKIWFTFRLFGRKNFARNLRKHISFANKMKGMLQNDSLFEIVLHNFTFVNFALKDKNEQVNRGFYYWIIRQRKCSLFPMYLFGKFTMRITISYENMTEEDLIKAAGHIKRNARKFLLNYEEIGTELLESLNPETFGVTTITDTTLLAVPSKWSMKSKGGVNDQDSLVSFAFSEIRGSDDDEKNILTTNHLVDDPNTL